MSPEIKPPPRRSPAEIGFVLSFSYFCRQAAWGLRPAVALALWPAKRPPPPLTLPAKPTITGRI